ncbi:MAG TPA: hypothetical protein VIN11_08415 [Roseivirga sp.]
MAVELSHFLEIKESIAEKPYASKNFTSQKKQPLKYLQYRLMRPYLKWKYNQYQKSHPKEPWLCPDAIIALKKLLKDSAIGLEYGSGRSTTFFAPHFDKYISIEHHKDWFEKVKIEITELGLDHVIYHHIPAEYDVPQQHLSSEEQAYISKESYPIADDLFSDYTNFILTLPDNSLDFVLVDGRARRTCTLNATAKLVSGGLLVLDNSERDRYNEVHSALKDWPSIETTTGLTNTTIWRKP